MSEEPFGRQLKPVAVTFTGGDIIDRDHWRARIKSYLSNQPCIVDCQSVSETQVSFTIFPDTNND